MNTILQTHNLNFSFNGKVNILNNITLDVPKASIYSFLGPNGAGKTTTIRILCGLVRIGSGVVNIFGQDMATHRLSILRRMGTLIEQPSLYAHLSGYDNLKVFALNYGVDRKVIDGLLETVGLTDAARIPVKNYSLGMKQRLAIAVTLLPDPELLILDEPTNGLDPEGIIEIRQLMRRLQSEGKTIMVSSHLLSEIEKISTHVGVIRKGSIVFQGPSSELMNDHAQRFLMIETPDIFKAAIALQDRNLVIEQRTDSIRIPAIDRQDIPELISMLVGQNIKIQQVRFEQQTLEERFIELTK